MKLIRLGILLLVAYAHVAYSGEDSTRYRGQYTLGHEANVFCPEINSRCYWLSGDTADEARRSLRRIVREHTSKPYEPVCVVLEANIDTRPDASTTPALSADNDGVIAVSRVFGRCRETEVITQGNLQHHRWVLVSIDGIEVDSREMNHAVPELDFGESMFVFVHTGCNRFSGKAVLFDGQVRLDIHQTSWNSCSSGQDSVERKLLSVIQQEPAIKISHQRTLVLESGSTSLTYRLRDWVN